MKIRRLNYVTVIGSDEDIALFDKVGHLYHLIMQAPFPPQNIIITLIEQYLPPMNAEERLILLAQMLQSIKELEELNGAIAAVKNLCTNLSNQNKSHN